MTDPAGLFIRLYLDVNIHHWLTSDLASRGFDAVHALDLGHERWSDEAHLRWASADGRVLLSFDRGDYQRIATDWVRQGVMHAGIILCKAPPRLPAITFHRRLLAILDHMTSDEMIDQIRWLDERWS
jgi:hypothetical protein